MAIDNGGWGGGGGGGGGDTAAYLRTCILSSTSLWSTQQEIALTTENPENCTFNNSTYIPSLRTSYWFLPGSKRHHNGHDKAVSINTDNLTVCVGHSVDLLVTGGGDLHLFVDGKHRERVWSGVPIY